MRHAVIVISYPFPGIGAEAHRVRALAEGLANVPGWRVTVVNPGPHPSCQAESVAELPYRLVARPVREYDRTNLLLRALREIKHAFSLLATARRERPDVIIVTIPSVFLLAICYFNKASPVVVDLRDLVWMYLLGRRGLGRLAGWILEKFAIGALKRSSAVTVTNPHEKKAIEGGGIFGATLVWNGISQHKFDYLSKVAATPSANDDLHVVYIGNVGMAQALHTLISAAAKLEGVRVTIVGGGSDFARLRSHINEAKIENVTLAGPVPWDELSSYYASADALYAQIGAEYVTAVPSKLFEYLTTGRRVIFAAPAGPATELARTFRGVSLLPPGNVEELHNCLIALRDSQRERPYVDNILKVGHSHLREAAAKRFAEVVRGVVTKRKVVEGLQAE